MNPSDSRAAAATSSRSAHRVRIGLGIALSALVTWGSVEWWSGIFYLAGLHGSLGRGLWPALIAVWALALALLLPLCLVLAWPALRRPWPPACHALWVLAGAILLARVAGSWRLARPTEVEVGGFVAERASRAFAPLLSIGRRLPGLGGARPSLLTSAPVECAAPISRSRVTLVATFLGRGAPAAPVSVCRQAEDLPRAVAKLRSALAKTARRGPLKLDLVTGLSPLPARHAWLDALKLRPGLDGVCREQRCSMPWQLLSQGFFSTHRPLDFIPDFQFGVASESLQKALGGRPEESSLAGLVRITTESFALDMGQGKPKLTRLARMRRLDLTLDSTTLDRALRAAEGHVLAAQQPDGKFRYTLDPMTGVADTWGFNLARQAGTTLVLCELGRSPGVDAAVARSARAMLAFERRRGPLRALTRDTQASQARLSESALPLVSLMACRERLGAELDEQVAGLAQFILALQRDSGGFAPGLDLESGEVLPGPEPLYAGGQAILGLLLLEGYLQAHPSAVLPPHELVHEAAQRAMSHVAGEYWSHPLRDFFFIEENWHCLAARAALTVHRHPGYEQFCLDYVRFKSRLILEREHGVDADFDGGFGFGNVVPPHNTGAAGFGEALAAALRVLDAQDRSSPREQELLRRVLVFLLRQQWSEENCFACATPLVIGGMSEHTHSALTRIDFVQHAWAALGHGGAVLGLAPERQ